MYCFYKAKILLSLNYCLSEDKKRYQLYILCLLVHIYMLVIIALK